MLSTGLAFATTPEHQTGQAETIQLEGYGTVGDEEEDPHLRVHETVSQDGHLVIGEAR